MPDRVKAKNAVAAIRVSTTGQGTDGDSPEAQKEQAERYAASRGITIKKFFVFLESASKELQPMQEAIDYCKNPKNEIDDFFDRHSLASSSMQAGGSPLSALPFPIGSLTDINDIS